MERVLTNAEMREADSFTIEKLNVPSRDLMRRAGIAIADEAAKYGSGKKIIVVCGTGNNGGDGYVCAEELNRRGFEVSVYAVGGALSADCLREKSCYTGGYCTDLKGEIIVDCLFGTGLNRPLEGKYSDIVNEINSSGAFVISADIPSGLNGDNGLAMGAAVKADVTVAIAEYKVGHFLNDGADLCGKIVKADIGITCMRSGYAEILSDADVKAFYPRRKRNTHKGTYGTAQLIVGSDKYLGAAALAAEAALKSGCGYVKVCTSEKVKLALAAKLPQVIFSDEIDYSAQAIAIGCGCGVTKELFAYLSEILKKYTGTLFIDADGLNALSKFGCGLLSEKKCRVTVTPHIGEFSRLTGLATAEILSDPVKSAKYFALKYGVTVLLKSAASVLTDGFKTIILNRGNSALAKAGSGDMLTGFACGTAARGIDGFFAAAAASYTLGLSAEICAEEKTEYCVTAKDLIKNLHRAVRRLTQGK